MIEIHSHLLPGIDDGPPDLATALQMAQIYINQDVDTVICTPHIDLQHYPDEQSLADSLARIEQARSELTVALAEQHIDLNLHIGAEIRLTADLANTLKKYRDQFPLTLAGTSYLLIELPGWQSGNLNALDNLLFNIQLAGYTPILAHPEKTLTDSRLLLDALALWVRHERLLLQVNASSLLNLNLPTREQEDRHRLHQSIARQLLDKKLVHFIASDAHHPQNRPPRNRQAWEVLAKQYSPARADQLAKENPATLLADQPIFL